MDFPKKIRPHGNRTQIRFKSNSKEYTLFVDGTNRASITSAIQVRDEAKVRLKLGLSITEDDEFKNATFQEVAQEYLSTLEVEHSTAVSYIRIPNRFWLPPFADKLITDIKPNDTVKRLATTDISQKTKRYALGPLRKVYIAPHLRKLLNERFRDTVKASRVRYRRPYNCRHTYASEGLSNGLEPAFLAGQLGHTLEVFYRTYAH